MVAAVESLLQAPARAAEESSTNAELEEALGNRRQKRRVKKSKPVRGRRLKKTQGKTQEPPEKQLRRLKRQQKIRERKERFRKSLRKKAAQKGALTRKQRRFEKVVEAEKNKEAETNNNNVEK